MSAEEIYQLASSLATTGAGTVFKLPGWRMGAGPIAVQIYTTQATAFVGTVKLQGAIASETEISAGTEHWSDINGASWTAETVDALFAKTPYIRVYVSSYTSGQISIRLAY
jgi:hypothetical protein